MIFAGAELEQAEVAVGERFVFVRHVFFFRPVVRGRAFEYLLAELLKSLQMSFFACVTRWCCLCRKNQRQILHRDVGSVSLKLRDVVRHAAEPQFALRVQVPGVDEEGNLPRGAGVGGNGEDEDVLYGAT